MKRRLLPFCLAFAVVTAASARAQTNTVQALPAVPPAGSVTNKLAYAAFLDEVLSANLNYAAQRFNVSIAQAALEAARVFLPNPTLSLDGARDVTHGDTERMPTTSGFMFTQTIELGGKRRARIRVADLNLRAASATLEDFLRNLRADASAAFVDGLALTKSLEQKRRSARSLDDLVAANEQRLRVGDVGEVDVTQSRVEALQFQSELLTTEADARAALIALSGFLGRDRARTVIVPVGRLELPSRAFDLDSLLANALANRADLVALRHTRDAAKAGIRLAKTARVPDVDVGAGVTHSTASQNSIAPSPSFNSVGISLALPLPLWNQHTADINAARYAAEQAEKTLQAAEQKAEIDVRTALTRYQLAQERVARFRSDTLTGADKVLAAKRFSYQRGQTTLLDLLSAQRSANEVYLAYYDALSDAAKALIELERSAQLWDVNF